MTRASRCERAVRGWISGNSCKNVRFVRFTPPLTTIRNETFFRVDEGWRCWQAARGWLCLTDAQRYYTTLQFWQVPGTADGCIPKWGRVSGYLWGVTLCPSARYSGQPQIWDAPRQMGCIQDIWRASRPILSARRGAGETPAIPRGYAIILDARRLGPRKQLTVTFPIVEVAASRSCLFSFLRIYLPCGISPKRKRESPTSSHRVESEPS